jgi:hypothetical protein
MAAMTLRGWTGLRVWLSRLIRAMPGSPNRGRQLLHGGEHEFFLAAEVVPQGHVGLGCDLVHPGGMQPARSGDPWQRVRDLPPPILMIGSFWHPVTASLLLLFT